jgi:hypothetical protein
MAGASSNELLGRTRVVPNPPRAGPLFDRTEYSFDQKSKSVLAVLFKDRAQGRIVELASGAQIRIGCA